jgi:catechol 2,3-dioxygenase-like lactoylglutathione lyase family enzyme
MNTIFPDDVGIDQAFPVLAVADLEAALRYYAAARGFREAGRGGEPAVRAGVGRGGVELQLVRAGTPGAPPGPGVVYCHAHGVAAYHAACAAAGAAIPLPLETRVFGLRDFWVQDSDGNRLGFGEPST